MFRGGMELAAWRAVEQPTKAVKIDINVAVPMRDGTSQTKRKRPLTRSGSQSNERIT
jgi:hypothetical protein